MRKELYSSELSCSWKELWCVQIMMVGDVILCLLFLLAVT